jgi:hypothetical protein
MDRFRVAVAEELFIRETTPIVRDLLWQFVHLPQKSGYCLVLGLNNKGKFI